MYSTFDGPSGEACLARRDVSNSPLQALTLLNDVVFIEAARALGSVVVDKAMTDEQRAELLFRRCLTRCPEPDELKSVVDFAANQRSRFASKELDAEKFAGDGTGDAIERAAWTTTARALLNLNETITKQ
jgi:hypothetical protein